MKTLEMNKRARMGGVDKTPEAVGGGGTRKRKPNTRQRTLVDVLNVRDVDDNTAEKNISEGQDDFRLKSPLGKKSKTVTDSNSDTESENIGPCVMAMMPSVKCSKTGWYQNIF